MRDREIVDVFDVLARGIDLHNHFGASLVIIASHHLSRFSGTMLEASAFNADIQQLMA